MSQNYKLQIVIIGAVGLLLTALYAYGHLIDGDVIQLLRNAHVLATQGIVVPYGNATSSGSGGHVPGAFLSLAAGLPMLIWHSPWAALAFLTLLHLASWLLFANVLRNFVSGATLVALGVLYWLNPWRASEVFLWNPSYTFIAALLHFWTAYHLSKQKSLVYSCLHALSLFLALQIHPSFVILVFMTFILLISKSLRPHWGGAALGVVLGTLSLLPYILAGLEDPNLFPQPGSGDKGFLFYGLVYVYPVLKAVWYWVLFGSTIFQTHVFHQLEWSWVHPEILRICLQYFWLILKYIVGVAGVLLSFYVNYRLIKTYKEHFKFWKAPDSQGRGWLINYCVAAFVSGLIAVAISPSVPIYWHMLYIFPFALIPLLLFIDQLWSTAYRRQLGGILLVCAVYFVIFNVFAAMGSKKHTIYSNFHETYHEVLQ